MKILYLSALASKKLIADAHRKEPRFSGYAVQKFSRLLAEGMAQNGAYVTILSSFFLPSSGIYWHHNNEAAKNVNYKYIPSLNIGSLRHIWIMFYCFIYVFFWGIFRRNNKAIICDVLNVSQCLGAVAAARIVGLKRVGIVTDIPGMVPGKTISDIYKSKEVRICMKYIPHFTHYVLLTKQMNSIVNPKNKPYIIMEGLVDSCLEIPERNKKESKRIAIYAGGLREEYGLKLLVEGFLKAAVDNSELWIYGSGAYSEELHNYSQQFDSIKFFGVHPNEEIVETEMSATLLINPRPTKEELTQYSFPSKNMEYMVSGTPVLTTILPGMPEEYYEYVYLFDQGETIDGYASVIKRVLSLPEKELKQKGKAARQWVLDNKNNNKQSERILSFIN